MAPTKTLHRDKPTRSSPRKQGPSRVEEEAMTSNPPAQEVEIPSDTQAPQEGSPQAFIPLKGTDPQLGPSHASGSQGPDPKETHVCLVDIFHPREDVPHIPSCRRGNQLATTELDHSLLRFQSPPADGNVCRMPGSLWQGPPGTGPEVHLVEENRKTTFS